MLSRPFQLSVFPHAIVMKPSAVLSIILLMITIIAEVKKVESVSSPVMFIFGL
jgi:hypothetical protein